MNRFALGAAMGMPACRINASATGWFGMRTPTVSRPAVTISGIDACLGSTSVNGPGHQRRASLSAASGHAVVTRRAISIESTCTISGLVAGRPLASKIRRTASGSNAFAPSP